MVLEVRSDLKFGIANDIFLTQYGLKGTVVVHDKLESGTNYFNNIYTLGGSTIHVHDQTEFVKDVTLLGNLHMDTADKALAAVTVKTNTIKPKSGTQFKFDSFTQIDFDNATFINWPNPGGGGGAQFPLVDGKYQVDAGMKISGDVLIDATTLAVATVETNTIKFQTGTNLKFDSFTEIDFDGAAFINWPGSGSGQFPLVNGKYVVDAGMQFAESITILGATAEVQVQAVKV